MKKFILSSIIVGVSSIFLFSNSTAFASTETQEELTKEYTEIVPTLSEEDFNKAFEKLGDTSNLSESEKNEVAMEALVESHDENSKLRYSYLGFNTNAAEDKLFKSNPFEGIHYARASIKATEKTIDIFKRNGEYDASDAFRHSYWNAVLTIYIGASRAKVWTDAHETTASGISKTMDLYNNNVGREIGKKFKNVNDQLSSRVYNDVKNGKMKIVVDGKLINSRL